MPVDLNLELRISYLRAAHAAIEEEESKIQTYRAFYDGEQGVKLTDRQKEYLTKTVESFGNICKRVVNVPKDRLELKEDGISGVDEASQIYATLATDWWNRSNLNTEQKEIYQASLRDKCCALIVGWNESLSIPSFTPNLIYDGATGLVRFHYDSDNNLLFASKRWNTWNPIIPSETGKSRLTIYRPGLIERYEADSKVPGGWRFLRPDELRDELNPSGLPNPQFWTDTGDIFGEPLGIPVIPFENPSGSELADVINIQELLNHGLGTFDIVTDFHGFPIIWTNNLDYPIDPSTGNAIMPKFEPGMAFNLKNGNADRIEPADLMKAFNAGVLSWVQVIALIKGWPLFSLDRNQQVPSGIALRIMEGGLVAQVKDKQAVFSGAWRKAFDIARKLWKVKTGQDLQGELKLNWQPAETADEKGQMETLKIKFDAGQIPTEQRWIELGYTLEQIADMKQMKTEQMEQQQTIFNAESERVNNNNGQEP